MNAPVRKPSGLLFAGVSTAALAIYSYHKLNSKAQENFYVLHGQNPYSFTKENFGAVQPKH